MGIIIIVALLSAAVMYLGYDWIAGTVRTMPAGAVQSQKKRTKHNRGNKASARERGAVSTEEEKKLAWSLLVIILGVTFIARMIGAGMYKGYEVDMNCFFAWADMVFDNGFGKFYQLDGFTDYPPGYMYVLYAIGGLRSLFGIEQTSLTSQLMTKFPAILCDMAIGVLIYKIACKRMKELGAAVLAGIFLITPAIFLDSAIWGQVDSVFTLFVVLMCYFATEKKLPLAYFAFAIGILIKPQTLIFGPVLLFAIVDQVFLDSFRNDSREVFWKKFFIHLGTGLLAIGLLVLLMVPFGFSDALKQYTDTVTSYPYASVNAYNLWTLFGQNWTDQTETFLAVQYHVWGMIFIALSVVVAAVVNFKTKEKASKYYFVAALLYFSVFCLSVRMHERYAYPALVLMLLAYASRPRKHLFLSYIFLGIGCFFNMAHAMVFYDPQNFSRTAGFPRFTGLIMLILLGYLVYIAYSLYIQYDSREMPESSQVTKGVDWKAIRQGGNKNGKDKNVIRPSAREERMGKADWIAMAAVTVVYAIVAFVNLGNMSAPTTSYSFVKEGEVVLDFGKEVKIKRIWDYLGNYNNPKYVVSYSNDRDGTFQDAYSEASPWDAGAVFCWNSVETDISAQYVKIAANADVYDDSIIELAFQDEGGNLVQPVNAQEYPNLFDEQEFLDATERYDGSGSYHTGTYFDEIYHARTAYEMIHGLYNYENTHPPLGKFIISLGIRMFGMNPFGWRFMGTLFGVLMLPIIYLFARRLLHKTWLSCAATVLFAFDFMHFAQTRIATIDVFVTLFIMLAYYFMYCYTRKSFYDTDLKKTFIPLGLCGIAMGLSWASKWTGIYSSFGLCLIFFLTMWQRFREYTYAVGYQYSTTEGISHQEIVRTFYSKFWKTIGFCVIFFVAVPAVIYLLAYIPFEDDSKHGLVRQLLDNQSSMFNYHNGLRDPHDFSSMWYEWPIMKRPIWYFSGQVSETLKQGISSFGNPLVWWMGIPVFFFMCYRARMMGDRKAAFLVFGFLSQYLPWVFIKRTLFIYHFFPSVPFIVLMIGYGMKILTDWKPQWRKWMFVYVGLAVALFVMFYPVLSGMAIDPMYVKNFLRWFDSWVLISV